ncbi:MAG: hypothetical protein ABI432_00385 [Flavobacteriales bacterium]
MNASEIMLYVVIIGVAVSTCGYLLYRMVIGILNNENDEPPVS